MTAEEYAALGAEIQAAIVTIIETAAPKAKVWGRDPVSLDEEAWAGSLRSPADVVNEREMIHSFVVTFGGWDLTDPPPIRSIEPTFVFRVQLFHYHDSGTDAANSEKSVRDELLAVQLALAKSSKLGLNQHGIQRHTQLRQRVVLRKMAGEVLHRGDGELKVELQPFNVT